MHFFQGNPEMRNPVHIIIYIITERTGKCQEKIRKTDDDRKTKLPRNKEERREKVKFSGNKEAGKAVRMDGLDTQSGKKNQIYILKILQYNAEIYAQTADYDREQNKKSCNIMQKFITELQTMTVNKTKIPAI